MRAIRFISARKARAFPLHPPPYPSPSFRVPPVADTKESRLLSSFRNTTANGRYPHYQWQRQLNDFQADHPLFAGTNSTSVEKRYSYFPRLLIQNYTDRAKCENCDHLSSNLDITRLVRFPICYISK